MKKIVNALIRRIFWIVFFFFPVNKKRVLFSSFYGRGYGDNLKYICNELKDEKLDFGWVVNDDLEAKTLPKYVKPIYKNTINLIFYLATSKVWIDNCRKSFVYKKKSQFYIQTWHGGGAQKKCEADAIEKIGKEYIKCAIKDSKYIDVMISESRFMTNLYHSSFWYDGPVYECGYPRYDILLEQHNKVRYKVHDFYHINYETKMLLYAPTFRNNNLVNAYNIDLKRLQHNLEKRFKNNFVILVHLHPNIANKDTNIVYYGTNIINCTFYPDTQELLSECDFLIGDYSSINYDFCIRQLPVVRYVNDLKSYNLDRGTYFDFSEYPFPYATDNEELERIILNFDNDKYLINLNNFFNRIGSINEYGASKKVSNLVLDCIHMKNNNKVLEKYKSVFIYKEEK